MVNDVREVILFDVIQQGVIGYRFELYVYIKLYHLQEVDVFCTELFHEYVEFEEG